MKELAMRFGLASFSSVRRECRTLGCVIALSMLTISPVRGQSLGGGSIEGAVTDESRAAMPGVTVTASSPALQVPQVAVVSGGDGTYRFTTLPAGIYEVTYDLAGFQRVVRKDLRVSGGVVSTINVTMVVGAIETAVTVVGLSPVVDIKSTAGQTNFTKETLQTVPLSRTMWNVFAMTPGVRLDSAPDVGGNTTGNQQAYSSYGVKGQSTPMIEGLDTREGADSAGFFYDYSSFDEVQVKALGSGAEVATAGTNFVGIVKSGGNQFHGRYFAAGQTYGLQSKNLDDDLRARGVQEGDHIIRYSDLSGDLGGRIIRDKLWFYGSILRQSNERTKLGYSKEPGADGRFGTADDVAGRSLISISNETAKFSYQPSTHTKVIGFYTHNIKAEPEGDGSNLRPFPSTQDYTFNPKAYKGEIQSALTSNILIDVLAGYVWYYADRPGQPKFDIDKPGSPSTFDITSGLFGGPNEAIWNRARRHRESTGNITFFPGGILGGKHSLKAGYQIELEELAIDRQNKPSGNYQLRFDNGVPLQIVTYNLPVVGGGTRLNNYGVYAQDTWTVAKRVTINLGLRGDRFHSFVDPVTKPQGAFGTSGTFPAVDVSSWNGIAPRLGIAFDVTGDAKTVLKSTYGLYNFNPSVDFADNYNQNTLTSTTYTWHDLNGNRDYNPGEVNLNTNGLDFISTTGAATTRLNPDLKSPTTEEFSASIEREAAANLSIKAVYVFKRQHDLYDTGVNVLRPLSAYDVAITRQDPGPDGALGTADDGGALTLYDYNPSYRGSAFVGNTFVNRNSSDDDRFQTIELTANKRRSNNFDLVTSFSATKNHRFIKGVIGQPSDDLFRLDTTWAWQMKVSAGYSAPHGIQLGMYWQGLSGVPNQRTYIFRNLPQSGTLTVRMEPFGSQQLPTLHSVNLRVGKRITIRKTRVDLAADVFNLLNANTITGVQYASGPTFGQISSIFPPRILRLGATFEF
jgi:Carboxypeptidase regulatory-like domain